MALKMMAKQEVIAPPEPEVVPQKVLVDTPALSEVEALTAEYMELYQKFMYFEVKTLVSRMEEVRKSLVAYANEMMDAKKPAIFASPKGEVEFSARGVKNEIPNPLALVQELLEKFGPEVTASVVDIALTPLRKLLSEFELKKHLVEEPGSRTIKSVRPT